MSKLQPGTGEDPNLILIVKARKGDAANALVLSHNGDRYVPSIKFPETQTRESTPPEEEQDDTSDIEELRLTFDKPPKDIRRGFSFGTNREACDVLLGSNKFQSNISGVHFSIGFDKERRLVLQDDSTRGTSISYDGWGKEHGRRFFK